MSTAEASNKNTMQLPYINMVVATKVSKGLSGIGTQAIGAEYGAAVEQDPMLAPFVEARLKVTPTLGLTGRNTSEGKENYHIHPAVDYLSGVVLARTFLAAQHEANGGSLPAAVIGADVALINKMNGPWAKGSAEAYPALIGKTLVDSGCGEDIISAITNRRVPLIKQIGILETLAFYADQPIASAATDSAELLVR